MRYFLNLIKKQSKLLMQINKLINKWSLNKIIDRLFTYLQSIDCFGVWKLMTGNDEAKASSTEETKILVVLSEIHFDFILVAKHQSRNFGHF